VPLTPGNTADVLVDPDPDVDFDADALIGANGWGGRNEANKNNQLDRAK